jgi:phosphate transport system substrate-binding protein
MRPSRGSFCSLFLLLLGCELGLWGCTQTPTPTVEILALHVLADSSTQPLVSELTTAFVRQRPSARIQVEGGLDTERILDALQAGQVDVVAVSWLSEEIKREPTLWFHPFAQDALVLITHHSNSLSGLSLPQLRTIYQGQTLNWGDLGGPAIDVVPVTREEGAGIRSDFDALVMGKKSIAPTAVLMPNDVAVAEYVATNPGAIGYVSTAGVSPAVNVLAVEGVSPSVKSVEDGRYLLSRQFYLVAPALPHAGLATFTDWILTGEGRQLIQRNYAPWSPAPSS